MKKTLYTTILQPAIFLFVFAGLLTSCTHYHYAPTTNNVPLLKEKGKGKISGHYYGTDEANGFEFQGAVTTGKNIGVMVNFLTAAGKKEDDEKVKGNGTYVEAGLGYYKPFADSSWIFETYAGIGTGAANNRFSSGATSDVGVTKYFIQPSIGFAEKGIEIGFAPKLSYVNLRVKKNTLNAAADGQDYEDLLFIEENPSAFIFEPGFIVRGGFKNLLFTLGITSSINLQHNWKQEKGSISLGICLPINFKPLPR